MKCNAEQEKDKAENYAYYKTCLLTLEKTVIELKEYGLKVL